LDNESGEVVSTDGDVERAYSLLPENNGPQAVLFTNLPEEDTGTAQDTEPAFIEIDAELYNSVEDMEAQVALYAGEALPRVDGGEVDINPERDNTISFEGPCSSYNLSGLGDFYYYRHKNYSTEMTSLRRLDRYYTRNHWIGSTHNDEMSSLISVKPWNRRIYSVLYQHSCFNGRAIGFYAHYYRTGIFVRNLKWYRLSGALWWRTSWNDQVSSTLGLCY